MKVSDFFTSFDPDYVCSHDMFGTCRKGTKCRYKHIKKTPAINNLIYHIKDPSKLINRADLIKGLNKFFKGKKNYYITTCTFKLKGHTCQNECKGRHGNISLKYKGKDIDIQFCYGKIQPKYNRIMIALHIDIEYEIKNNKLIRETIVPLKSDIDEEDKEKIEIKDMYFPKIGKENDKPIECSVTKKEQPKWTIVEKPKIEKENIVTIKNPKKRLQGLKELKLDMSKDIGPIVNHYSKYELPFNPPSYRLYEPVLYSDLEKMSILNRMSAILVS
tara:strand:- start:204 stop:1025 length:822 start_codon:yes stop_codon:yes gene_type:complete